MQTLSVLIVEDDLSFSIELDMLVREIGYNVLGRVDNSAEALDTISTNAPDIILMDIHIKGKLTGIEIAENIIHLDIPVLFITSFGEDDYYERAKQTNIIGYLVKPVNKYSLKSYLEIAVKSLLKKEKTTIPTTSEAITEEASFPLKEFLFFKKKGVYHKVKINEIYYLEADGDYSLIQTADSNFVASTSLSQMEDLLTAYSFMRIHRSYLVNLKEITSIDATEHSVYLKDKKIPYSRSKKKALLKQIQFIK